MMQRAMRNLMPAILMVMLSLATAATANSKVVTRTDRVPAESQNPNIYTIKEAGLQFEVPKGWKAEVDGKNVVVSVEDGAVSVTFIVEDDYAGTVKGLKLGLNEKLTEVKSEGEPQQDTHNGMVHTEESGTGLLKGTAVRWSIDVLKAGKPVTILTFGIAKILEAHGEEYVNMVMSMKKM